MYTIVLYSNISVYLRFLNFRYIFLPTNFAENLKVSLSMNRILLNLKEILIYAWPLQNYVDLFADGL